MLLKLYDKNPSEKTLRTIRDCIYDGGIIIYPTDTVYGFACDIKRPKAIDKIAKIKNINAKSHDFTIVCDNISRLTNYVKPISNQVFRMINRAVPGPYTFIIEANNKVPKLIHRKKKTIGIRIPDNPITQSILKFIDAPLLSSSVLHDDEVLEYRTDPELIHERYQNMVDLVIDGGYGNNQASTIVDFSKGEVEILRYGLGPTDIF